MSRYAERATDSYPNEAPDRREILAEAADDRRKGIYGPLISGPSDNPWNNISTAHESVRPF